MTAEIGRNEPCPCGSGKKYKNCCLICSVKVPVGMNALWSRLYETDVNLNRRFFEFFAENHDPSRAVRTGDMLYCRVVVVAGLAVLNECGSFPIPPRYKPEVIRMRAELRKVDPRMEADTLILLDAAIRIEGNRLTVSVNSKERS